MVFLANSTQGILQAPAGAEAGLAPKREATYRFDDFPIGTIHSVQLSGDPLSESFVLSALVEDGNDIKVHQFLLGMTGSIKKPAVVLQPGVLQPTLKTYLMAVPSRTAIEYFYRLAPDQPYKLYQALEPTLIYGSETSLKLRLNLFTNFADANPAQRIEFDVQIKAEDTPMLVCVYGPPYGRPGTVRVILFGRQVDDKKQITQLQAWSIDGDGKTTPIQTPMRLSTEVQEKTAAVGPSLVLTCMPCKVWIEYTPWETGMTEFKQCGQTLTSTPINTYGNQVLEVTLHGFDPDNCDSTFVEYRAWPPGNISEVDCRQNKTNGVWGTPYCTVPEDVKELLGLSRFGINTDRGPEILELGVGRNDQGELVEYERRWNQQRTPTNSATGCPRDGAVSGIRIITLESPELATGVHHASARAWGQRFIARTTVIDFGDHQVLGAYLWEPA